MGRAQRRTFARRGAGRKLLRRRGYRSGTRPPPCRLRPRHRPTALPPPDGPPHCLPARAGGRPRPHVARVRRGAPRGSCGGAPDPAAAPPPPRAVSAPAIDPPRSRLQTTLGTAYTLERELGGGAMARAFVAEETRFRRRVVLKVLAPEL